MTLQQIPNQRVWPRVGFHAELDEIVDVCEWQIGVIEKNEVLGIGLGIVIASLPLTPVT